MPVYTCDMDGWTKGFMKERIERSVRLRDAIGRVRRLDGVHRGGASAQPMDAVGDCLANHKRTNVQILSRVLVTEQRVLGVLQYQVASKNQRISSVKWKQNTQ